MSQNRPIYKSTSTIAITEVIKPSYLTHINPVVQQNREGSQTTNIQTKIVEIQHNQSHVTSQFTNMSHTSEFE